MHVSGSSFRSLSSALAKQARQSSGTRRGGKLIGLRSFFDNQIPATEKVWRPTSYSWMLVELLQIFSVKGRSVLDVGCGSGILALSVASRGGKAFASDILPEAVEATKRNAAQLDLEVVARQSDGLESWIKSGEQFDFIVCNPPCFDRLPVAGPSLDPCENSFLVVNLLEHYGAVLRKPGCLIFVVSGRDNMEWVREHLQQSHELEPSVNHKTIPVENVARSRFEDLAKLGLVKFSEDKWFWDAYYFAALQL